MVEGIRPDKVEAFCKNCGGPMRQTRRRVYKVPMSCDDCSSGGTVIKNNYEYISGTYGAVGLVPVEGVEDIEPDGEVVFPQAHADALRSEN